MNSPWTQHLIDAQALTQAISPEHTQMPGDVVIIDCRFDLMNPSAGRTLYAQGHIPGAHYLDLNQDLSAPLATHGGRHPLPDPVLFAARLRDCGVNEDSCIVAYDDNKAAFASRLWYLCHHIGHHNVRVLDGGFSAWKNAGLPVSTDAPAQQTGNLVPRLQPGKVLDYAAVSALSARMPADTELIDSREEPRYLGLQEPIDPIAGHIPGAKNLPWMSALDERGHFLPEAQQRQRWAAFSPDKHQLVVYCGSGVTACVNLLSLALIGHESARLYAGSWSDWCSYQPDN